MKKTICLFNSLLVCFFCLSCGGSDDNNDNDYDDLTKPNIGGIKYDDSDINIGRIQISGAVDMGLSVKWGACNIGASFPYEYGGYYAWGEVTEKPYSSYEWSSYIFSLNSTSNMLKYCDEDNKTILDLSDDVANVLLGQNWRIPTSDEMNELITKCTSIRTTYNGVYGYLFTSPNGNKIFLPQAGHCWSRRDYMETRGDYWTSTLGESNYMAKTLRNDFLREDYRYNGMSIRPVKE